jgi:hypothetical protein
MITTLIALLLCIPSLLLRGWVFITLWKWFAVPYFHVSQMRVPVAIGLCLLYAMIRDKSYEKPDPERKLGPLETTLVGVIASLFTLGFGWIAHQFMQIASARAR